MSHGVTENTAGLNYSGDAGGLNEATSDIFGTSVEFYASNSTDVGDYLIGEKIDINGNGTPLRYMDKPSKDGASQDCWTTSTRNLDPHYSSGPLNHCFYLASEGSGAKTINGVSYNSPTCDGSTVTGAGRDAIAKVWYRTLSTKLTSGSTYASARNGAIASAKELYGATSATCTAVEKAFTRDLGPRGHGDLWRHHPAAHGQQPAAQPRLRVRRGELDRHVRPDHEQHRAPGPHRLVEDVARRQRHDVDRERAQSVTIPSTATSRDPSLLDPHRHRRVRQHGLRHREGADRRRHDHQHPGDLLERQRQQHLRAEVVRPHAPTRARPSR